jgi:hypothetical protein
MDYNAQDVAEYEEFRREAVRRGILFAVCLDTHHRSVSAQPEARSSRTFVQAKKEAENPASPNKRKLLVAARIGLKK